MVFKICFYVSFVYFQIIYESSSSCSQVYTTDSLNYLCSCCFVLKPKLFITEWFKIAKKTHLQRPDFYKFSKGFPRTTLFTGGYSISPPPGRRKLLRLKNGLESLSCHINNLLRNVEFQFCMNIYYSVDTFSLVLINV